ncbi:MAG TPA: zinc ribbon domain-containing protein [Anaerolineales bacterium]|nr:zinc ribbon domain-containing protein [Anaerolineales bacterium]
MHKRLLIVILLVLLCTSPAYAQGAVALKTFNVQLWAEHDQPSMLVIYTFEVSDDTQIPTSIDIRVPADGNITAVAFEDSSGPLLADYTNKPAEDADWQVITIFLTERTTYRVEYYQPLEYNGDKRSFNFQWTGDHPVESFDVEIQVPNDSTGVKTTPAIPFVQEQVFLSGGAMLNSINEGDGYQLQLEYSRTSDTPSVAPPSGQQVEPLVPIDANTDGRVTLDNLPLVFGGFGAVLIAAALFYFLRSGSSLKQQKPRRRHSGSKSNTSQIHCHECGTRAHEGDRFCRICGSKLRA